MHISATGIRRIRIVCQLNTLDMQIVYVIPTKCIVQNIEQYHKYFIVPVVIKELFVLFVKLDRMYHPEVRLVKHYKFNLNRNMYWYSLVVQHLKQIGGTSLAVYEALTIVNCNTL